MVAWWQAGVVSAASGCRSRTINHEHGVGPIQCMKCQVAVPVNRSLLIVMGLYSKLLGESDS